MATCAIIDAVLYDTYEKINKMEDEEKKLAYQRLFLFAAMWGIGGAVGGGEDGSRAQKDFHTIFKVQAGRPGKFPEIEGSIIFDFYYDVETNDWAQWVDCVKEYEHPEEEDFLYSKILVHNK